jgi:hypothetical protein
MDEPPISIIVMIVILASLVVSFIYLGGTVLILVSSWVPMKTRLRWMALSAAPLALLVTLVPIAVLIVGKYTTALGAGEHFGDAFAPVGLFAGLLVAGVIAANWLIFRRFRAEFPRALKSRIS